jgi:hypothetical protein
MASSSILLLNTLEWAKTFNFGRSFANGTYLEPAMTSANTVLQTIVGAPFSWRWNRVVTGFISTIGQQDYLVINWSASLPVTVGTYLVDAAGYSQKVTTAGTTTTSIPSFNATPGGTTTDGTAVWTNQGLIPTKTSSTYSLAWIETSSIQDVTLTSPAWIEMESKTVLGLESKQSRSRFISAQLNDSLGNMTFRLMQTPDKTYPVAITIQQKPGLFTSVNQTWSPIPDEYSHIYNWGFLAMMYMYADDPRFAFANQKFVAHLLAASEGLTDTEVNIFLQNWQYVTGSPIEKTIRTQQGGQARGT